MLAVRMGVALALALAIPALVAAGAAAKGGANCAGKPGSPDRAALLQYCPKGAKSGSGAAPLPGQPGYTPPAAGGEQAKGKANHHAATDKPTLPATSYPSSGGVNLLVLILVLLALGGAVTYGARRWRRSRPQPSR